MSDQISNVSLGIEGMSCAACSSRLERVLNKVDGVTEAVVNLATEQATIAFDPRRVQVPVLIQRVEAAGFSASELEDDP